MRLAGSLVRALQWLEDGALITALLTMLGLALLQIVLRNFFDAGLLWAESFLRILVLWVAMLGAMVATRQGNHISVDALARYLPVTWTRWFRLVTGLFSASVCGLVAWYSLEFVGYEYEDGTIAFGDVPSWLCQVILPIGFGVMAIRFAINAVLGLFQERQN